jgi:hypothetical protein
MSRRVYRKGELKGAEVSRGCEEGESSRATGNLKAARRGEPNASSLQFSASVQAISFVESAISAAPGIGGTT